MNAEILIKYEMNLEELFVWNAFCEKIKLQCDMMQMPDISKEIIDKKLTAREPFYGNRGYSKKYGYYEVQEGDRGHLYLKLNTFDENKAVCVFLSCIAHDVGYQYVTKNEKQIEKMNVPMWHYYNEYTIVDNGNRFESKRIINSTGWIYDCDYDYRKYWFELTILYLAKVYDNLRLLEEIKRYQQYMNHQFEYEHWEFSIEKHEFVEIGYKELFSDYPENVYENPFDSNANGKYFAYLTNRKRCLSYLSSDLNAFNYNNEKLYKAMLMGYTSLYVCERYLVADSEGNGTEYDFDKDLFYIFVCDYGGIYTEMHQGDLFEKCQKACDNWTVEGLKEYLIYAKQKMKCNKLMLVGAKIIEKYNWH